MDKYKKKWKYYPIKHKIIKYKKINENKFNININT